MKIVSEITVAGAGPAGSICAGILANLGHEVLLLDKSDFPRDKACGDLIAPMAVKIIENMGLRSRLEQSGFNYIDSANFVSNYQTRLHFRVDSKDRVLIAPRKQFDKILFDSALDSGARFQKGLAQSPCFDGNTITGLMAEIDGEETEIKSRLTIVADGSHSKIAAVLNQDNRRKYKRGFAVRTYLENAGIQPHTINLYVEKSTFPGYTWMFPVENGLANLGVGTCLDKNKSPKHLKNMLLKSYDRLKLSGDIAENSESGKIRGSYVNVGFNKHQKRVFNGALIAGDAANLVNPLSGAGIVNAMVSGRLAAEIVHDCLKNNSTGENSLYEYENRLRRTIRKEIDASQVMIKLISLSFPLFGQFLKSAKNSKLIPAIIHKYYPDIDFEIVN